MRGKREGSWRGRCCLFALLILALASSGPSAGAESPNLLFVTIDTWRWDYLSSVDPSTVQTPHLDALAREGLLFTDTRVAAPVTLVSHASLFTGADPPAHGVHHNGHFVLGGEQITLAEALSEAGYQTAAVTGAYVVNSRYGLNQGFSSYLDVLPESLYEQGALSASYPEISGEAVTDRAIRMLDRFSSSGPWFLWVHYFDPHGEYRAPQAYADRYPDDPYAAEVAYVDDQLGRLFDRLRSTGEWAETAVVVTSDHGESLGDHGETNHGHFLYESTVRVSTLLKLPGAPVGVISNERIRSIDLMPTVLEALGASIPETVQGRSVRAVREGDESHTAAAYAETFLPYYDYGWAYLRSLVLGQWKYIHGPDPELYDLETDPGERKNLASKEEDRAAAMLATLRQMVVDSSENGSSRQQPSAWERSALASLGYIGVSASPAPEETETELDRLPDPKKMIHLERTIWEAWAAHGRGKPALAVKLLDKVLEENPRNTSALRFASALSRGRSDWDRSLRYLEQLAQHWPSEAWRHQYESARRLAKEGREREAEGMYEALLKECAREEAPNADKCLGSLADLVHLKLGRDDQMGAQEVLRSYALETGQGISAADLLRQANLHLSAGMVQQAEETLDGVVQAFPSLPDAHLALGNLYRSTGRNERAVRAFERAIELDPAFVFAKINLATVYGTRGDFERSNSYLLDVLEWDPRNSRAVGNLALNLYLQGQTQEALELFEKAIELDPGAITPRLNMARAYLELNRPRRAVVLCREVARLDPQNPVAREVLERYGRS